MASLGAAREGWTDGEILLEELVTQGVKDVLEKEVPKLVELVAGQVYQRIRKRVTIEEEPMMEGESSDEEGRLFQVGVIRERITSPEKRKKKTYHEVSTEEEEIRRTLSEPRCLRCRIPGHTLSTCTYGKKVCLYCNRLGHLYDDCVERMVTKREIVQDPYFPVYDPWEYERIQYK